MVSDYQYNVLVTLSEHKKPISSIIELENNLLVTSSWWIYKYMGINWKNY